MDSTSIITLANEAGATIPFYQWHYEGKLPFTNFEDIPIVTKDDTYNFQVANPQMTNYYGEDPSEEEVNSGQAFVLQSSINKRKVLYEQDDTMVLISYFLECVTVGDIIDEVVLVLNATYHAKTWLTKLSDMLVGIDIVTLVEDQAFVPTKIRDILQPHRDAGKKIVFVGTDVWMQRLLALTAGGSDEGHNPVQSVHDDDVLLFLPKSINPWNDSTIGDSPNNKLIVFSGVETGMKGIFRVGVCDAYADSTTYVETTPIYHLYREDIYEEVIDGINCITWGKHFPHIRWTTGDYVEIVDINCACGFQGKGLIFQFREDDPEGIIHHQDSEEF